MSSQAIPNFFIIGAMKCGTTSLHNYLAALPGIFMSEPKEPGFFVQELNSKRGHNWYLGLFAAAGNADIVGESSTHYTKLPTYQGVVDRIYAFNPDARFVYLMRDPLDRIVSHYWHNVRDLRFAGERRSILNAVRRDPQYSGYSDYAMQLEPYLARFGRDRLYVETFETFTQEPEQTLSKIVAWLGLEHDIAASLVNRRWNAKPERIKRARGTGSLNRLRYAPFWHRLSPLVPRSLRSLGNRLAEHYVTLDGEAVRAAVDYLRPDQLERTSRLSVLLDREFPEWTTLYEPQRPSAGRRPERPVERNDKR